MNSSRQPTVTAIIVNYKSKPNLLDALVSLEKQSYAGAIEVIIVNNSPQENLADVTARFPSIKKIILPKINIGFARAINLASTQMSGDYMLLMNPDTVLDEQLVRGLVSYAIANPRVAVVAPRIDYPNGRIQPSRGKFPSLLTSLAFLFELKKAMPSDEAVMRWAGGVLGLAFGQYRPVKTIEALDYAVGSCLLIRKTAFDEVGGMDPRFFLFYEEIELSKRLKSKNWHVVFLPNLRAIHQVGQSYKQEPIVSLREKYLSMSWYFRLQGSRLQRSIIRLLQIASLSSRILVALIRGLINNTGLIDWDRNDAKKLTARSEGAVLASRSQAESGSERRVVWESGEEGKLQEEPPGADPQVATNPNRKVRDNNRRLARITARRLSELLRVFLEAPPCDESSASIRLLVSACLLGSRCTFDNSSHPCDLLIESETPKSLSPICPEHAGGLPTPRNPAWLKAMDGEGVLDGITQVVDSMGVDVSTQYIRGAYRALLTARLQGAPAAILKARSPSCGVGSIEKYGTYSATQGNGVTAALLQRWGVYTFTEEDSSWISKLLSESDPISAFLLLDRELSTIIVR